MAWAVRNVYHNVKREPTEWFMPRTKTRFQHQLHARHLFGNEPQEEICLQTLKDTSWEMFVKNRSGFQCKERKPHKKTRSDFSTHRYCESSDDSRSLKGCHSKKSSERSSDGPHDQKYKQDWTEDLNILNLVNDNFQTALNGRTYCMYDKSQIWDEQVSKQVWNWRADCKYSWNGAIWPCESINGHQLFVHIQSIMKQKGHSWNAGMWFVRHTSWKGQQRQPWIQEYHWNQNKGKRLRKEINDLNSG